MKNELPASAVQAIPAVTLVGVQLYGLSISEWAAAFGIAFIALQAAYLIWRWIKEARKGDAP